MLARSALVLVVLSAVTGPDSVTSTGLEAPSSAGVWRPISTVGSPSARRGHTAVWTGNEMLVWGGHAQGDELGDGAAYNPATDTWRTLGGAGAPSPRSGHTAIWTGREMVVWGGMGPGGELGDGARYNPADDSWRPVSLVDAPSPRAGHVAIWTGDHMLVWGGARHDGGIQDGAAYEPAADSWTPLAESGTAPALGTAAWTGSEMIVLGSGLGAAYDPATDAWRALSLENGPSPRHQTSVVWTGAEILVWGGLACCGMAEPPALGDGARYEPAADAWTQLAMNGSPSARVGHTAVCTGNEMLIWGGLAYGRVSSNEGAAYNPALDSWSTLPSTGAPSPRANHTAVWTGSEMLVWGGEVTTLLGDGGRFSLGN